MTITRWDPLRDLLSLQEQMNRLFEESLARSRTGGESDLSTAHWSPPVDIAESAQAILVTADLPGVEREDIELRVEEDVLTLSGERRFGPEAQKENYLRVERSYGAFRRSFTLPNTVDQEGITARFTRGVLEVALPKKSVTNVGAVTVDIR